MRNLLKISTLLNVFALDAVAVALGWQMLLAQVWGVELGFGPKVVLCLSVWLVYMGDRWRDVQHMNPDKVMGYRHRFIFKHFYVVALLFAFVLFIDLYFAFYFLNVRQFLSGLFLLGFCIIYIWQFSRPSRKGFIPKEVMVSAIFTGGVIIFLLNDMLVYGLMFCSMVCALFVLFLCNLMLFAFWEKPTNEAQGEYTIAHNWKKSPKSLVVILLALFGVSLTLSKMIGIAVSVAALGLLMLWGLSKKVNFKQWYFLADWALLSPWVVLGLKYGLALH